MRRAMCTQPFLLWREEGARRGAQRTGLRRVLEEGPGRHLVVLVALAGGRREAGAYIHPLFG
jgi:hypothetical protein